MYVLDKKYYIKKQTVGVSMDFVVMAIDVII